MTELVVPRYGELDSASSAHESLTDSLPAYFSEPEVEPYHPDKFTRFVSIDASLPTLDFGTFIVGKVVVTPKKAVEPGNVVLEIVGTEKSMVGNGQFWRSNKRSSRSFVCGRVILPFHTTLEPNYRYRFPFSLQFPVGYDHIECKNGLNHCTVPPTLGVDTEIELSPYGALVNYQLRAYFSQSPAAYCRRNLLFTPRRCLLFDLDTFVDEKNNSLDRSYSASARLMTRPFRGTLAALVTFHSRPFRHDGDSDRGNMTFNIEIIPTKENWDLKKYQDNVSVSFIIHKVVYAAPDGMKNKLCKTETNTVHKYRVATGDADVDFEWDGLSAQAHLSYGVAEPILLRTPNFVSCHTAVSYEFEIVLKHKSVTASLSVPMIVHYPQPLPYSAN